MEKPINLIIASLQSQRNSSLDKVVDLEVSNQLKENQIAELREELLNANATINSLREIIIKKTDEFNQQNVIMQSKESEETNDQFDQEDSVISSYSYNEPVDVELLVTEAHDQEIRVEELSVEHVDENAIVVNSTPLIRKKEEGRFFRKNKK